MKITGITAEYNPLHNGHIYQMEQARALTGCDAVVVAMSGDFVQRGEPAILDKWTRCGLAIDAGADLVAEIPVQFCLGNASQYASASVSILESLGCDSIAFGSECADAGILTAAAGFLDSHRDEIGEAVSRLTKTGISYPAARTEAYRMLRKGISEEMLERELSVLDEPNDILALEYIRSMKTADPVCVKRVGAGYGDSFDAGSEFQSAGALRTELGSGKSPSSLSAYIPESTLRALSEGRSVFPDEWTILLRYAAMMAPAELIEDCPSAGEGLGNLIKECASVVGGAETWEDMIKAVKSKRYTYTRISRLCMQLILGITRNEYASAAPQYIRVLGFSDKGRKLLSELKSREEQGLPVITNINKETHGLSEEARHILDLDVRASDLYNLVAGLGREYSDHIRRPVNK